MDRVYYSSKVQLDTLVLVAHSYRILGCSVKTRRKLTKTKLIELEYRNSAEVTKPYYRSFVEKFLFIRTLEVLIDFSNSHLKRCVILPCDISFHDEHQLTCWLTTLIIVKYRHSNDMVLILIKISSNIYDSQSKHVSNFRFNYIKSFSNHITLLKFKLAIVNVATITF